MLVASGTLIEAKQVIESAPAYVGDCEGQTDE
jgi:hypothetical protein